MNLDKFIIGLESAKHSMVVLRNMLPKTFFKVKRMEALNKLIQMIQIFWFANKVLFFVFLISWFKPEYKNISSKIILFIIAMMVLVIAMKEFNSNLKRNEF
ncbi:MAG TPA: hypothetical protein VN026_12465 [Bacteroidia bacterium]|jgi:hypothetical protein|nr:hypothetical protein [Bacteroidia bacterium]